MLSVRIFFGVNAVIFKEREPDNSEFDSEVTNDQEVFYYYGYST